MRSDLDRLMAERGIDAFIIPATEGVSPQRDYLTGGIQAHPLVIKKRGSAPVLIAKAMERDEAAKSGLAVLTYEDFRNSDLEKQHGRNTINARAALWERIIEHFEITGMLTFYGHHDIQEAMRLISRMQEQFAGRLDIGLDSTPSIFDLASETKDAEELSKMRDIGARASAVMRATRDWLNTHRTQNDQIVDSAGKPLTIGAVKRWIRYKLMEVDLEDPQGSMIFAQGRDAGVPHSRGEADEVLRPGETVIFDLFPRPVGGGYHHDMTRTWCLGYAPEHIKHDYDLLQKVYFQSLEEINLGEPVRNVDRQVCERLESAGHLTRLSHPHTNDGFAHGLGHGLGLEIHESPPVSQFAPESVVFKAGHVVTIEPGLYYPDKGYGMRIEDTVYLDDSGQLHNLTDCPYDLVIPLNG